MYGDDIAEVFSNKYEQLYNSARSCEEEINGIIDRLSHLINDRYCQNKSTNDHVGSLQDVIAGVNL